MAARTLPDHSFPVGRVGERAWGGEMPQEESGCPPRPRPCPRTGRCFPILRQGGIRGFARGPRGMSHTHSPLEPRSGMKESWLTSRNSVCRGRRRLRGETLASSPSDPTGRGPLPPRGSDETAPLKPAPGPYHGVVVAVERHGQEAVEVILQVFLKQGQETDTDGTGAMGARNAFPGGPASGRTCLLDACLEEPSGPARGREGISRLAASPAGGWVVAKLRRRGGKRVKWEPGS